MRHAIAITALLLSVATGLPTGAVAAERVDQVRVATARVAGPRTLEICAAGTVLTGGYTRPTLARAKASRAGVYDFTFTAVRPTGFATQMVSPISATFTWRNYPTGLKGVRVMGAHGAVTAMLGAGRDCPG
jgi:hypothetical protein